MANARIAKECNVSTPNEPGAGAKVAQAVADAGVNILGFNAYAENDVAKFRLLTADSDKACASFKGAGLSCRCAEVVVVETTHRAGAIAELLGKIAKAGVNVSYCYATATGGESLCVFNTGDNAKALAAVSG
ncbi:MAG: hypothetical protein ACHQ50_07910 [Fimbriimonadales bacterium]